MKKILFLLLFPVIAFGQYTSIPDSIFEQRLIDFGYDTIHDGQVLTLNIVNVDSLTFDVPYGFLAPASIHQIKDFTGIEDFVNLTYLDCSLNAMDSLDLSQNTSLSFLECTGYDLVLTQSYGGKLKSLKLGQNTALTHLDCSKQTLLSNLDVSQNTGLTHLNCSQNNISSLDVSQNTGLTHLNCSRNNLSSLDVSQNIALDTLMCGINKLTNLDVSQNTSLIFLSCSGNYLTDLDVSNNSFLTELYCIGSVNSNGFPMGSTLRSLDLRNNNNINMTNFNAIFNPNLYCINVDDSTWSASNWSSGNSSIFNIYNIDSHTIFSNDCDNIQYSAPGYTAIFDSIFEQKLIDLGYDTIHDGQVLTANIINIDSLFLSGTNNNRIYNLDGIEDFTNLTYLECDNNYITTLDLSQNSALTYINCRGLSSWGQSYGSLYELNLPQNNTLVHLNCPYNRLLNLDLSQNTALTYLDCAVNTNGFDTLDVSHNPNLSYLGCSSSGLESLDLTQNNNLDTLFCLFNQLTNLDLSQNTALIALRCDGNNLTSLDLTQNTSLTYLSCSSNNLSSLDVRNGNNVNFYNGYSWGFAFNASFNDSLFCISVDDSAWSANNWSAVIDSHTVFSNDCNPSSVDIIENLNNFLIYPNPTRQDITISIENFNGNIQTEVYDLIGNRLQTTNQTTISLRDYSKGIYILKVAYGDRVQEVKVIKE